MSVFQHPWLGGVFHDAEAAEIMGPQAQMKRMLRIEAAWSRVLGDIGRVEPRLAAAAALVIEAAEPDIEALREGTARDGLAVPTLVKLLKAGMDEELWPAVHKGLTSQDVIDTELVLALDLVTQLMDKRLALLAGALDDVTARFGAGRMMGRTRMQAAVEITVADRVLAWQRPLLRHRERLMALRGEVLNLQFGGAAGTRDVLGDQGDAAAAALADHLGLGSPPAQWHSARGGLAEVASWLSLVSGSLGKMGQDISLMAQQGLDEIEIAGGGSSSAMPHKQNPILAELLVTLARFNATQLAGMHHALVHEQERSGAAWALEWMLLPQMVQATARGLGAAIELTSNIRRMGGPAS